MKRGLLAAAVFFLTQPAHAVRVAVVVDDLKPAYQELVDSLKRNADATDTIRVHDLKTIDLSDPLTKGRFLAQLAAVDLIVPIGDPAAVLVSEELEENKTFFVAAATLRGEYLSHKQVAGVLSYSPQATVRIAKALIPELKTMGVLYTPGYETVVSRMEAAAREAGLTLVGYRVASRQAIGPTVRKAVAGTDLIWIAGDPLFTQDLIFNYLLQESVRSKKPLAASSPSLVEKGALFCAMPDAEKLAGLAFQTLSGFRSLDDPFEKPNRVMSAPGDGFVLVNQRLAEKWGIHIPASLRLWDRHVP